MSDTPTPNLPIEQLERVYDALAQAIDSAGEDRRQLFLVKLALLNANALGSADVFETHLDIALRDL